MFHDIQKISMFPNYGQWVINNNVISLDWSICNKCLSIKGHTLHSSVIHNTSNNKSGETSPSTANSNTDSNTNVAQKKSMAGYPTSWIAVIRFNWYKYFKVFRLDWNLVAPSDKNILAKFWVDHWTFWRTQKSAFTLRRQWHNFNYFGVMNCWLTSQRSIIETNGTVHMITAFWRPKIAFATTEWTWL